MVSRHDRGARAGRPRDEQVAHWQRVVGNVVGYPVPTQVHPPEAFDVVLKRKRLVVAAVEGRLVDGSLRPTEQGRAALAALAEANGGTTYDLVVVPEPAAAASCVMAALVRALDGTAIVFLGCDMAVVGAIRRRLNIRWDCMLKERAHGHRQEKS